MSKTYIEIRPKHTLSLRTQVLIGIMKPKVGENMKEYKPRIVDKILERKLKGKGAVLIEGPKWCGKTTTAEQAAKSVLYMADPDNQDQNLVLAEISPKQLLIGETPRLIDEWQLGPKLWDAVRFEVDHRDSMGQFILTGSAVPVSREKIHHTGTGRFSWLFMRPMSLFESNDSTGEVSLQELFDGKEEIYGVNKLDINKLAFLICRGGWPRAVELSDDIALDQAIDYYDAVVETDASRVDGITRNPERVKRIMRSIARNQASQVNNEMIMNDIKENEDYLIDIRTVSSYIEALKQIFVIEDMPAWNPNLRSKTAIRTKDTRYFVDPSIGAAAQGLGPNDLINDLNTFGFYFEAMCVRDLRVFADALGGNVYHFRDKTGLECDAVVHLRNGSYGLIEIKLGGEKLINEGVENLIKLEAKLNTEKMKKPSFKMVLTGTGTYAYRRPEGVFVVPIGCLKN